MGCTSIQFTMPSVKISNCEGHFPLREILSCPITMCQLALEDDQHIEIKLVPTVNAAVRQLSDDANAGPRVISKAQPSSDLRRNEGDFDDCFISPEVRPDNTAASSAAKNMKAGSMNKIKLDQWKEMQRDEYIQILKWKFRPPDKVLPRQMEHVSKLARSLIAKKADVLSEDCSQEEGVFLKAPKRAWKAPAVEPPVVPCGDFQAQGSTAQDVVRPEFDAIGSPDIDVHEQVIVKHMKRSWQAPQIVCVSLEAVGHAGDGQSSLLEKEVQEVQEIEENFVARKRSRSWQAPSVNICPEPPESGGSGVRSQDQRSEIIRDHPEVGVKESQEQIVVPSKRSWRAPSLIQCAESGASEVEEEVVGAQAEDQQAMKVEEQVPLIPSRKRWHAPPPAVVQPAVERESRHSGEKRTEEPGREEPHLEQTVMAAEVQDEVLLVPSKRPRHSPLLAPIMKPGALEEQVEYVKRVHTTVAESHQDVMPEEVLCSVPLKRKWQAPLLALLEDHDGDESGSESVQTAPKEVQLGLNFVSDQVMVSRRKLWHAPCLTVHPELYEGERRSEDTEQNVGNLCRHLEVTKTKSFVINASFLKKLSDPSLLIKTTQHAEEANSVVSIFRVGTPRRWFFKVTLPGERQAINLVVSLHSDTGSGAHLEATIDKGGTLGGLVCRSVGTRDPPEWSLVDDRYDGSNRLGTTPQSPGTSCPLPLACVQNVKYDALPGTLERPKMPQCRPFHSLEYTISVLPHVKPQIGWGRLLQIGLPTGPLLAKPPSFTVPAMVPLERVHSKVDVVMGWDQVLRQLQCNVFLNQWMFIKQRGRGYSREATFPIHSSNCKDGVLIKKENNDLCGPLLMTN